MHFINNCQQEKTMRYREHYTIQPTARKWLDVALAMAIGVGLALLLVYGV
jgi:hypothetical protein